MTEEPATEILTLMPPTEAAVPRVPKKKSPPQFSNSLKHDLASALSSTVFYDSKNSRGLSEAHLHWICHIFGMAPDINAAFLTRRVYR